MRFSGNWAAFGRVVFGVVWVVFIVAVLGWAFSQMGGMPW